MHTLTGWVYTTEHATDAQPVSDVLNTFAPDRFGCTELEFTGVMWYTMGRVGKLSSEQNNDLFAPDNAILYDSFAIDSACPFPGVFRVLGEFADSRAGSIAFLFPNGVGK